MNWVSRPISVTGGVKNYFELPIFRFELLYDIDISWLFQIITLTCIRLLFILCYSLV